VKSYKQALMTVFVVFATAYVLTILGCSKSSDVSGKAPAAQAQPTNPGELNGPTEEPLQPIDPRDMRECTADEFATLVSWSNDLAAAKDAVQASGGRRSENTVKLALIAIQKCDQVEFYHGQKPCKKITRVVTQPDNPTIRAYDAYRIDDRCKPVENYLKKFNLRPDPRAVQPEPEPTTPVNPPPSVDPIPAQPNPVQPVDPGNLVQCSADEFAKLNSWRAALDAANKNIAKLGGQSNWKYDSAAVDSSKSATALCESLITYHQARPCKREKVYTAQSLREQCATARTYNYNFAQRTESLIVPGARLYLNTSIFADRTEGFKPGPATLSHGQCVITNLAASTLVYSGQKALVTEARVYTDPEYQMFVLQTQEGLKLECYGVNYSSLQTSLSEVIRLLAAKDTRLPLSYELN